MDGAIFFWDLVQFISAIMPILTLITVGLLYYQIRLAIKAMKADHERWRKQATFEFVNAVSNRYKNALHAFDARHGPNIVADIASYDEADRSGVR
jgi:hypothetical protein